MFLFVFCLCVGGRGCGREDRESEREQESGTTAQNNTHATQQKHRHATQQKYSTPERREHLRAKTADEAEPQASKVVLLDELVQVEAQQLEGDAQVRAERKVLADVHDVVRVAGVGGAQVLQHAQLDLRLRVEALLVADDLERAVLAGLVVEHLEHLAKAAAAEHRQHLVAVVGLCCVVVFL